MRRRIAQNARAAAVETKRPPTPTSTQSDRDEPTVCTDGGTVAADPAGPTDCPVTGAELSEFTGASATGAADTAVDGSDAGLGRALVELVAGVGRGAVVAPPGAGLAEACAVAAGCVMTGGPVGADSFVEGDGDTTGSAVGGPGAGAAGGGVGMGAVTTNGALTYSAFAPSHASMK